MTRPNGRISILGTLVDKISLDDAVTYLDQRIRNRQPCRVVVTNVSKVIRAKKDPKLLEIVNSADLIGADGVPLIWVSKLFGDPLPGRVNGTDLMYNLLELAERKHYRIYLLGARRPVIERMAEQVKRKYPGIQLVGWRDGYFSAKEVPAIVDEIKRSDVDILFIGMGTPKKEIFAYEHFLETGARVSHGVGGSFDVFVGDIQRAPLWMQRSGLEWLYRLLKEPKRMWKRYLFTNTLFVYWILREAVSRRIGTGRNGSK